MSIALPLDMLLYVYLTVTVAVSACGMLMNQVARVRHFGHHFEGGSIVAIIKITSFTWHTHVAVSLSVRPSLRLPNALCAGVFWFCGFVVDVFLVYYLALRMRPTPAPWAPAAFWPGQIV